MGYYDKFLMHDDRDKGMNSTSNEKGTDGKKNNTSEYNHQYYMKNKDKWRDNKSSVSTKLQYYKDGDSDFDNENYDKQNWVDGTDFYIKEKPDGSIIVLEEDMKWTLPPGTNKEQLRAALKDFDKRIDDMYNRGEKYDWEKLATEAINSVFKKPASGEKEFDVDAAARDVIRGKYGNGAERKAALGDDYAAVQKRVNEMLGVKTSEPKKTRQNTSKPVDGPKEAPHANFQSSSQPRSREKNVTGEGTGLYRRGEGLNEQEKKKEYKFLNRRSSSMSHYFQDDSDHLEHHGIKGQKWGVRRFENKNGTLTTAGKMRYGEKSDAYNARSSAKTALRSATKDYNKSFDKAYANSSRIGAHITKKGRENNEKLWTDFVNKSKEYDSKKAEYKNAKKAYKEEYKKNLKSIDEKSTFKDRLMYNEATRVRAAKIMTKYKDISMAEANAQAKKEANRNTAAVLTVFGLVTLGEIYASKNS